MGATPDQSAVIGRRGGDRSREAIRLFVPRHCAYPAGDPQTLVRDGAQSGGRILSDEGRLAEGYMEREVQDPTRHS